MTDQQVGVEEARPTFGSRDYGPRQIPREAEVLDANDDGADMTVWTWREPNDDDGSVTVFLQQGYDLIGMDASALARLARSLNNANGGNDPPPAPCRVCGRRTTVKLLPDNLCAQCHDAAKDSAPADTTGGE